MRQREELRLCQWNIERGGQDRDGSLLRWPLILQVAKQLGESQPDIVWVNEAHRWVSTGRADEFAAAIGASSWKTATNPRGYDMMMFLRGPLTVEPDTWQPQAPWMARTVNVGLGTVTVPEPGWPDVMAAITHLSPWSGQERWMQAFALASLTDDRGPVILAGDFNCIGPHDPEPRLAALRPSEVLKNKTPESSYEHPVADRRALSELVAVGWHDVADLLDEQYAGGRMAAGTPTSGWWGGPDMAMPCRKAHILLNPEAEHLFDVTDYQVHGLGEDSVEQQVSDHLPITATLALREPAP
ncbi:endonuclease/exonuclease/phosphatase family protein [Actinocatenispora comari]|uniref:Endonuclease/exonuclease/phosphatase domain-containing protein n=1 Tax=Actinocatenispora comari TaxID=2807577 RepID=A0A8J4AMA9_9ACTN|nr:endonuclease/exonuclease/phosphatase family protein [Actinocatenispora comari]GIL32045.1 hypothetical protein NUM_72990 [Actinocatenispora comari]